MKIVSYWNAILVLTAIYGAIACMAYTKGIQALLPQLLLRIGRNNKRRLGSRRHQYGYDIIAQQLIAAVDKGRRQG
ncbi:hypothetical protein D3C80_1734960 [compost metagenome]